ncbi:hypothetical protein [Streptomyces sp. NBC_01320]|uniref:hypothetical protein n=1 Tax=Streptomyces sp. NBC_01320 TaxID=2903824 RepID=UPI002E12926B|nr:hypothetical protein OG395_05760 [Streptomyces sp. NBC_01320]
MGEARLQVIAGGAVPQESLTTDPWQFQAACVDAFVASWRARGFSPVTVDNDIGLLERALTALGACPGNGQSAGDRDGEIGGCSLGAC